MKYIPGLLVGQLSGKAGNTVASRNSVCSYIKTRTNPMLVRNAATVAARNNLAALSSGWRALSAANQLNWTALGASIVRPNSLGQNYSLTGSQAYASINRNLFVYGAASVTAAPVLTPPAALLTITPTVAA